MGALEDIRARAKDLLETGKVRAVLGYRRGTAGLLAEPVFVTAVEDATSLVWDSTCLHNLTVLLVNDKKRRRAERAPDGRPLAVVAKGCDSRALVVLMQENHIKREEIVILGVSCEGGGMADPRKVAMALDGGAAVGAVFESGKMKLATLGEEVVAEAAEVLADRCLECSCGYPAEADVLFGDKVEERAYRPRFTALAAVADQTMEERSAFWTGHFERCLRCYACRAVCPMCYCDECVVDSTSFVVGADTTAEDKANRIRWIQRSTSPSENAMYHLVRAMHLAGRCIDCGECERVCPVNIPIRLLNNFLEREALQEFEYVPGLDASQPSLISSFRDGDPDDFIR